MECPECKGPLEITISDNQDEKSAMALVECSKCGEICTIIWPKPGMAIAALPTGAIAVAI